MNPFRMQAGDKARIITIFFAAAGLGAYLTHPGPLPLALFYAILVLNTFYSVRFFSGLIDPADKEQWLIDTALVALYILSAASLGDGVHYLLWTLALFIAASMKYALLIPKLPHPRLLRRKIRTDLLGSLLLLASLAGTLFGYAYDAQWGLCVVFALANIYFLWMRPLYRLS